MSELIIVGCLLGVLLAKALISPSVEAAVQEVWHKGPEIRTQTVQIDGITHYAYSFIEARARWVYFDPPGYPDTRIIAFSELQGAVEPGNEWPCGQKYPGSTERHFYHWPYPMVRQPIYFTHWFNMYGIVCSADKSCNGGYSSNWLWLKKHINSPQTWFGFSYVTQGQCYPQVPPPLTWVKYLSTESPVHPSSYWLQPQPMWW